MKLPTLNIDVAVNTKTMQKGIAEAQKNLEKVGKKGLAFAGGTAGKIGSLAELGGGFGSAAIGVGGISLAAMAPIKLANSIISSFAASALEGEKALKAFAETGQMTGGLDLGTASRLAASAPMAKANEQATSGLWDTFIGSMLDEQGRTTGLAGLISDWAQATGEGTKFLVAAFGGLLSGKSIDEQQRIGDMAISRSAAGAQAYMSQAQIDELGRRDEKKLKAEREQNT